MPALPETVSKGWDDHKGPMIFATIDEAGTPNAIWVGCVKKYSEDKLVVADNYFSKTRANIKSGSKGAILFITNEGKSFQVKGTIEYQQDGEIYSDMKNWVNPKLPAVAAAVLHVEEAFSGAEKLL